jgi:hypothetical protein
MKQASKRKCDMTTANLRIACSIFIRSGIAIGMICAIPVFAGEPNAGGTKLLDAIHLSGEGKTPSLALVQIHPVFPPVTVAQINSVEQQAKKILPNGVNRQSFTDPFGAIAFQIVRPRSGVSIKGFGKRKCRRSSLRACVKQPRIGTARRSLGWPTYTLALHG